jgi:hypothetical protein
MGKVRHETQHQSFGYVVPSRFYPRGKDYRPTVMRGQD